jgi:hypothetical protein
MPAARQGGFRAPALALTLRLRKDAPWVWGDQYMRILGIVALGAALALAGCQTEGAGTASGSPEITIPGARPDQVKPRIVGAMMNSGARLKSDSDYLMVFERKWGNAVASATVGILLNSDGSDTMEQLHFSIADTGSGTRVVLDRYMTKVGAFGRESKSTTPANNAIGLDSLQGTLDAMAPTLAGGPPMAPASQRKRPPGT